MYQVIDISHLQDDPPDRAEIYRLSSGRPVVRDPSTITGIVVHQTSTDYAVSPGAVSAAEGDRHEALHRRALVMKSHASVFDGQEAGVDCYDVVISKPLNWYVYHANKLNAMSLGIEIEGNLPTFMDEPLLTDEMVHAARLGIATLVEQGRAQGMPIQYIWAHRQSDPNRGRDPGEEIWKRVVMEYAVPVLGLRMQPELVTGQGRPLPSEWLNDEYDPTPIRDSKGQGWVTALGIGAGVACGIIVGTVVGQALTRRRG